MSTSRVTIHATSPQVTHEPTADTSSHSTSKEYWVTRVVRQMQGCSPSRIDSVIQANLPRREIRWSQRPDTLCIPGLEGRLPYSTDLMELKYDPGFFKDSPWLCPELSVHQYRVTPEPLAQAQPYYDMLLGTVILCFALLSTQISRTRNFLHTRAKDFFYTENERSRDENKDCMPIGSMPAVYALLCITGSLYALYYAQSVYELFLCHIPLYGILAVYVGCFALMFTVKRLLSAFINWIFFGKDDRRLWRLDYNFLLIAETAALMPVIAAAICFNMPPHTVMWTGLGIATAAKMLLLYKAYTIFLPHFYCILHLLSYLCALEILPCLALWVALHHITAYLTITL